MKNKRLAYLLLPLTLLIWGLIAQRIWSATADHDPAVSPGIAVSKTIQAVAGHRPALLLRYGDPFQPLAGSRSVPKAAFAGSSAAPVTTSMLPSAAPSALNLPLKPAPAPAAPLSWPQIKYLGLITNASGGNQVVLLAIDNQEIMIKTGETSHEIKLVKTFRDSIQLSFRKQRKSFYRTEAPKQTY